MGTMSASDAAPLPRLGEVFFDVRGNSRSMRLSWYADTQVAVFSIWQGGMCTGTFRLAIADLPRMVETLQRGPGGQQTAREPEEPGGAFAGGPAEGTSYPPRMGPMPGQMPADFRGGQPDYGSGVHDYLGEPPAEPAAQPDAYLADPPGQPAGAPGYPGGAPAYPDGAPAYPGGAAGYPGGRSGGSVPPQPASPYHLAERPDLAGRVAGYLAAPDQPARPAEHRTEYLPGVSYPGAPEGMAYPHESGRQGGYGRSPMHYQAEAPVPQHHAGSPQPARADALGATTADYPAHYDAAVSDDYGDERPGDSLPYGRHRDGR
jgi:hypothetical protein